MSITAQRGREIIEHESHCSSVRDTASVSLHHSNDHVLVYIDYNVAQTINPGRSNRNQFLENQARFHVTFFRGVTITDESKFSCSDC